MLKHDYCNQVIDYHEIIECIVSALDAKDQYTAGHSQRVSDMALKVCRMLGLKKKEIEKIHIAAHLHDIGKIGVPDAVLNKETKLDNKEWEAMKNHPQIGADILNKSRHLNELKDIVLYHHERFDGKGYPLGLKGEKIPIGARIIAICDSIDAITSDRSYRKAYDFDYCFNEIEKNIGTMYDPVIGKYVLQHWTEVINATGKNEKGTEWMGQLPTFIPNSY
ncbi:MAG TPA: phosphohydrolase [Lachnospiraceae bacterium]|nr:phosphohydrolase [Lachnospiraceae bacterium]